MNSHDYAFPYGGTIEDQLIQDGRGGSFGGLPAPDAHRRRMDDLASDPGSHHGHASCRAPDYGPHTEPEAAIGPFYRPYEPEMSPPACYERLSAPPPSFVPQPKPEPIRYEEGLMTQALFDWDMGHLPETPGTQHDWRVGSSSDVIPQRPAEITIESLLLDSLPPDSTW